MNGDDAIKALEQGKTLVNYKDGLTITMENDKIFVGSANADLCIVAKTFMAERTQIWLNDNYSVRLGTAHLIVLPEEEA